jgi:hypothetical protein
MTRWLALISCALALTLVASMAFDGGAEAKSGKFACKATAMDGKQTKWKCGAGQKCCFDFLMGKGSCVAASASCL